MKTRTTEIYWPGKFTWRDICGIPFAMLSVPFLMVANVLMVLGAVIAKRNSSYSWETDVEDNGGDAP